MLHLDGLHSKGAIQTHFKQKGWTEKINRIVPVAFLYIPLHEQQRQHSKKKK